MTKRATGCAMEPDKLAQWRQADALFDQWLDLPGTGREAWLAALDAPEPVRRRLEQLIAAHLRPSAALDPASGGLAGRRLGGWTLEEELGRGGMAVVHRAWRERGAARQQAALKVLTLGALGAAGRERFQRETEILARLNHPNAAALVDSGVADDGTCWLAMPLVEGERIDRYCDSHGLDARTIVRLYLQVCDAVAYAHRNLVIHRDLKPSNVLVDAAGHVRLLDFGIGQFADATGERTQTMWRAMTPGYAAPEQLRGDQASTAIDIYGLGALLHRLLTGRTPQSATDGSDTTRPSLLVRQASDAYHRHYVPLRSDLDRVLLKALAEEPGQRYSTAEALADDLRRWLDGLPVLAQTPGWGYRARKFAARNRVGVAASLLLAASLAAGIGATVWQAGQTRREAENAQVQAQRAILVRDFLQRVFASTRPAAGGVPTALDLLDEGAQRARSTLLATDPLAAADILLLTGEARLRLNEFDRAREDLVQARNLFASHAPGASRERVQVEQVLSELARHLGDGESSLRHARTAVELGERHESLTGDPQPRLDATVALGMALFAGDPEAALAAFEDVIQALPAHGLENTELHLTALDGLTAALSVTAPEETGRLVALAEEHLRLSREIDGPDSGMYVATLADQVPTLSRAGEFARAEEVASEAVRLAERVYQRPHDNRAAAHCQLAALLHLRGRYDEAAPHYATANGISRELGLSDLHVQACFMFSGYVHTALGDHGAALRDLDRSWEILGELGLRDTPTGQSSCGTQASVLVRAGRLADAAAILAGCAAGADATTPMAHGQAFAELDYARGDHTSAARRAAALRASNPPDPEGRYWMRPWMLSLLLAHATGDERAHDALVAELGQQAQRPPLAACIAAPADASCLVLP